MVQMGNRIFENGQTVWLTDGTRGVVLSASFSDDGGFWEYEIEGLSFGVPEFDLLDTDPNAQEEDDRPPTLPPSEEEEEDVEDDPVPPPEITGDDEPPEPDIFSPRQEEAIRLIVQDVLQLSDVSGVGQASVAEIVASAVQQSALILDANLQALTDNVITPFRELFDTLEGQFRDLESTTTTTLSEIENRRLAIEEATQTDEGGGFLGFLGSIGAALLSPVDWFLDKIFGFLLEEWKDGNSR